MPYTQAEAVADCRAQLAQVEQKITECLRDRQTAANRGYSASTRRMVEQRLHGLYVMQYDIKQDLARCERGDLGGKRDALSRLLADVPALRKA